jgi:hypothetical protein
MLNMRGAKEGLEPGDRQDEICHEGDLDFELDNIVFSSLRDGWTLTEWAGELGLSGLG